ncbi:MAG: hypothetical protein E6344_10045 [Clostridium sp.]|nr:hypothetical protein [Clostridium sp.]MDU7084024.1 hypothetical protein [Clostridium sp.]
MKSINRIIKDLPLGASALVEERINHKNITFIIIKDRFKNFMDAPWTMEFHIKGGIIKKRNTLSAHLMVQVKDNFNEKFYPFHFNYFDSNSLKLLYNLIKQREVCIVVSDGNNEYISRSFSNNLGPFLKKYIRISIGCGHRWSENEYKRTLMETIETFQDITELWDSLGEEVYMEVIKK